MIEHRPSATTRTASSTRMPRGKRLLDEAQLLTSPESGWRYRIEQSDRRRRVRPGVPREAPRRCATVPGDGLHQGQHAHRRLAARSLLRTIAATGTLVPSASSTRFRVFRGDGGRSSIASRSSTRASATSAFLQQSGKCWPEATARREIAGILQVLGTLHRGQMLHRDLTPMNVFVCDGRRLKLGDFGIVRQQSDRRGITARTLNRRWSRATSSRPRLRSGRRATTCIRWGSCWGCWSRGTRRHGCATHEVRALPCSDHLREIVHRCIGERRKRYESADELIAALAQSAARG